MESILTEIQYSLAQIMGMVALVFSIFIWRSMQIKEYVCRPWRLELSKIQKVHSVAVIGIFLLSISFNVILYLYVYKYIVLISPIMLHENLSIHAAKAILITSRDTITNIILFSFITFSLYFLKWIIDVFESLIYHSVDCSKKQSI